MRFKKILIIFLCVALLASFSVSCFATSQESYGFYISPGEYLISSSPVPGYSANVFLQFNFTSSVNSFNGESLYYGLFFFPDVNRMVYVYDLPAATNSYVVFSNSSWSSEDFRYITILDGFYIYDIGIYQWWQSNVTRVSPGYNSSFFDNVLSIFTAIGQWISGAAANLTSMFFVDNSLTFVGTLSVAALSMAVVFLIIAFISRFLRFRA